MSKHNKKDDKTNFGINFQFAIMALFISIMVINFFWTYKAEKQEILEVALEKAEIIIGEYLAALEFAIKTSSYESDEDGKTQIHRNIVGLGEASKEFNEFLTMFASFKLKMISSRPRNTNNSPDNYESYALSNFERNPDLSREYKEVRIKGSPYIRYVVPLRIKRSCLDCHGDPKGEIDDTGYAKEGYKIGDLKGGISLTIPLFTEYKHRLKHLFSLIVFYLIITLIAVIISYFISNRMVRLNMEINEKNIQVSNQHETLLEYEKEKSELIEMIVHDLKNPLTTLTSGLEVVINSDAIDDTRLNALLKLSHSGSKRLYSMISDILDVSAMESKKFTPKFETLDAKKFINDIFDELKLSLHDKVKSIDLIFKSEFPPFKIEPNLLKRVLENIIFNAIRHSPPKNAEITAVVDYLDYDEEIIISISDKGEGINKEHIDSIFDKFFKVDGKRYSSLNKGLGLTFCKFAVGMMCGRIWAESKLGEGATFHFTIHSGNDTCKSDEK
ncbi:DUF3365 domain-containing protein [Thermodesulfobacteriota bacterium]